MNPPILIKALAHLTTVPQQEVIELIEYIKNPASRKKLLKALEIIAKTPGISSPTEELVLTQGAEVEQVNSLQGIEAIRAEVFRILNDKELFQTNGELARAIERELGVPTDSGNRFHESRQKIIQKAWTAFSSQKNSIFKSRIAKFLEKFGPTQDDHYQKLFDILSRRE